METRPPRPAVDSAAPSSWSHVSEVPADQPTIASVDPAQLVGLLGTHRHVVLLLGTSSPRSFLPAVAERYGGGPAPIGGLGYYNIRGQAEQAWILPLLEPAVEPHGARRELRRGYYLFTRGQVVGHHPGLYHPRFDAAMQRAERAMRASYSSQALLATARRQLDQVSEEAAELVIEHFDGLLGLSGKRVAVGGLDPYAILGVTSTATASEIRAAYHLRMREHHPDRVAQLDEDSKQAALRRSQEIIQAYQLLK